jgi:hypothetical protein
MKVKSFLVFALAIVLLAACQNEKEDKLSTDLINNPISADGDTSLNELPKFKFKTLEHDFGRIVDGVKVAYKFKFTNVGGSDLIISQVKPTCGCTATRFPHNPIKPGESAFIELTFDSSRRKGFNHKSASVVANTQPNVVNLQIKAMVISADEL